MSEHSVHHDTVVLARTFDASIARVFAAISDPVGRARVYGAGGRSTVIFSAVDVRPGGRDVFQFGSGDGRRFRGECIYHDIVPERRIVCTDLVFEGDVPLWVGVATLQFASIASRTQLKITAQGVWLDGADTIEGADARYATLLENLDRYLNTAPASRGP